jgi:ribosomal protein L14E/L6E/L27E
MEHLKNCVVLDREETTYDKPVYMPPSVEGVEYDRENMKKTMVLKNIKHVYKDKSEGKMTIKEYSHSVTTREKYKVPLEESELMRLEKEDLLNSIETEVSNLNLDDFKTKESIMKFGCDNGKSNGEKRKRMVILQKHLQDKQKSLERENLLKNVAEENKEDRLRKQGGKKTMKRYERMNRRVVYPRHRITTEEISNYQY